MHAFRLRDLFRDPLYRWEARRYWTWRRYLSVSLFMLIWVAAGSMPAVMELLDIAGYGIAPWVFFMRWLGSSALVHASWRVVLCLLAIVAGATAIAPEKVSGHFEQFLLTPVEPRRYALTRLAGRLRGFFVIWLALWPLVLAAAPVGARIITAGGIAPDSDMVWIGFAFMVLLHLDLLILITMDAAVGLRFSSTSGRTVWALLKSLLVCFLLVPAVTGFGALLASVQGADRGTPAAVPLAMVTAHMVLAALIAYLCLKQTERAVEKAFYQPGEA